MNKTVLITGASSGIGKASVKYFNEKGWNVIATMRTPEKEEELTQLNNVLVTRLDVTDLESIDSAVKSGIEKFGKIDVLVNNAGYGTSGPLESFPRENIIRQYNTNVIGLLDITRAVLPHFRANKDGVIVNISSAVGRLGTPLNSLYTGTKFAVEGISESLSFEMGAIGIKVKIVEPGVIKTDFLGRSLDFQNDESMAEYQPVIQKVIAATQAMTDESLMSPASLVAEVIFTAATDGTTTLRYVAGEDAKAFIEARNQQDDETFIGGLKKQFGL